MSLYPIPLVLTGLGVMTGVLAWGRFRPAMVLLVVASVFYLTNCLALDDFLASFTNPSMINLMLLLLLASLVARTDLIGWMRRLCWKTPWDRLRLLTVNGVLSAFLNNTLVMALFVKTLGGREHRGRILLPISIMTLTAGTCTLMGTSTNFIVDGFARQNHLPGMALFDFAPLGIPLTLLALGYLTWVAPALLPKVTESTDPPSETYFLEAQVLPHSKLAGKTVEKNGLRRLENLFLAELIRHDGTVVAPVSSKSMILPDDTLVFTGNVEAIRDLKQFHGLRLFDEPHHVLENNLVSVVLSHHSDLVGQTVREVNFRSLFNAAVVALHRGAHPMQTKLGTVPLHAGDQLILAVGNDFYHNPALASHFYLVNDLDLPNPFHFHKSWVVLLSFLGLIVLTGLGWVSMLKGALILVLLFYLLGYLTLGDIRKAVPMEIFFILGASLAISKAMETTGTASFLAGLFLQPGLEGHPHGQLAVVYGLSALMTCLMTNNGVAALMLPVAYALAVQGGFSPWPFLFAVAYGASANFLWPFTYQTNTMIYSLGGYTVRDFLKVGLGWFLLYGMIVVLFLPKVFPFSP